jgi:hypothetical protein
LDVFAAGFVFPKRVCVLAPGPNGVPHYARIPADAYVLAVSRAVLIERLRIDGWMMQGRGRSFYREGERRFRGVRLFRREFVERGEAVAPVDGFERYSFAVQRTPRGAMGDYSTLALARERLVGGSTISGNAVQLAHLCGAREILLCGVDMSGDAYFDGSRNVDPTHGDSWAFTPAFDRLIEWLAGNTDTRVWSLSPTRLSVGRWTG